MAQQLINLLDIVANQAAWDATVQTNWNALKAALRTLNMAISVQGGIAAPSTITIQLQNANGVNLAEQFYLRVRLCTNGTLVNAPNATMAATGGTTLAETIVAGKDLVFLSNASGLVNFTVTDAVPETVTIRPAPSLIQPVFANHNNSQQLVHA